LQPKLAGAPASAFGFNKKQLAERLSRFSLDKQKRTNKFGQTKEEKIKKLQDYA